jgi:ubiquinone/menaquinone biosynthesis C-methylase UbiE
MGYEIDSAIQEHYGIGVERDRLTTWGRLEAVRTRELLDRFLPEPPAVVLDVGGAEGAYALPLAAAGYEVHLIDPVERHVAAARAAAATAPAPLASASVGDARALPQADGSADAVLLLGPLYHLVEAADRAAALAEARRVLRPGGMLLAAAISRFASALDGGVRAGYFGDPRFAAIVDRDLTDGVHRNPDPAGRPEWFTLAYFHHPYGLRDEVVAAGFPEVQVLAVEGIGAAGDTGPLLDDPGTREVLLGTIRRLESEPTLLGASPHLIAVAVASG